MIRQELAHLLRAACRIVEDKDVIVVGSQAILGSFDEDDLPAVAIVSEEADLAFKYDGDRAKADRVAGAIGEFSDFHLLNAYYVDGVALELIALPDGWQDRVVAWDLRSSEPADPRFLEPHDLAASKLVAFREKDLAFVEALVGTGLVDPAVVVERLRHMPEKHLPATKRAIDWLEAIRRS